MNSNLSKLGTLASTILISLKDFICSESCQEEYRTSKRYFSRKSLISFPNLVYLLLSTMSNSLSVELFNILESNKLCHFTKSAFSQRRYQLKHSVFEKMNQLFVSLFYSNGKERLSYWHGFILTAIDGSAFILPKTPSTTGEFGTHGNGRKNKEQVHQTTMGRFVAQFDVLNHIITHSELQPIAKNEQKIVYQWIPTLLENSLTIFDRGFGSYLLFFLMQKYNKPFVIRLRVNFNEIVQEFVSSEQTDEILMFINPTKRIWGEIVLKKGAEIPIRLIKIVLPNGTVEVLATSLMSQVRFPHAVFSQLYHLRWGIETCFDRFKNKLLALCFLGHKAEAIYQEIYAAVVTHNIHQLLVIPAQIIVNEKIEKKKQEAVIYKFDQKINDNVTIGILKKDLFALFISPNIEDKILFLIQNFAKFTEPIRPNRTNKRQKSIAKRRNLITQTNFRRAG